MKDGLIELKGEDRPIAELVDTFARISLGPYDVRPHVGPISLPLST